jgi:hypothetical protein
MLKSENALMKTENALDANRSKLIHVTFNKALKKT